MPHHSLPLREVRVGAEAGVMEEHCFWLALHALLSLLSYTTQDYLYRVWSCIQWAGSIHTNQQPRECHSVAQGQSYGGMFSIKVLSSLLP